MSISRKLISWPPRLQFEDLKLFLIVLFLSLFIAASFVRLPKPLLKGSIPELADILSGNETIVNKAVKELTLRVGPDEALEILKTSGLPFTGAGHIGVHQVGYIAYKKYGLDALLHCKDYFLYACYHGAIIEAATDQGFATIKKMTDRCRDYQARFVQCAHATGHADLAIWNYNVPSGLKTCDELFEKETQYPGALTYCHSGVFMENIFGVHDAGVKNAKRDWLSADPYYPCNAVGEKYQDGCWQNQASRIFQMYNGDIAKTAELCDGIKNLNYTNICLDNLARQIHPLTAGDVGKVFELCSETGEKNKQACIISNASAYYSVGGHDTAFQICNKMTGEGKVTCNQTVIGAITADSLTKSQKKEVCKSLEVEFEETCIQNQQ